MHKIQKVNNFYEITAQQMLPKYFRRYFRMYKETLDQITTYIRRTERMQDLESTSRISIDKQVAMTCAYLGSKTTTIQ